MYVISTVQKATHLPRFERLGGYACQNLLGTKANLIQIFTQWIWLWLSGIAQSLCLAAALDFSSSLCLCAVVPEHVSIFYFMAFDFRPRISDAKPLPSTQYKYVQVYNDVLQRYTRSEHIFHPHDFRACAFRRTFVRVQ